MTTPAKTAAYTQCEQCGFWHTPDEPHCANCGVSFAKEYKTVYDEYVISKYRHKGIDILTLTFGVISGLVGFVLHFYKYSYEPIGVRILMGIVIGIFSGSFGAIIGVIIGGIGDEFIGDFVGNTIGNIIGHIKARRRVLKPSTKIITAGLRQNEKQINQRLGEIGKKTKKIREVIQELKQQGNSQRNRLRFQTLDKGAAELSRQRDRYTGKLREIELIRWSNQLLPLLSHSPQLSEQQTTERLELLGDIQTQGQKLAQTWRQTPLADEETRCADRLNQALTTCDQLRQDLLDLKTALAVGDISAFSKEEQRASQTALELLDTFNALPDVGGFTAGFKKLEDEYFRLQSEDEVRQLTK